MTIGDRVVVLQSEHRGTIVGIGEPAVGEEYPIILVKRDDLPPHFAPIPYDQFELSVCNV